MAQGQQIGLLTNDGLNLPRRKRAVAYAFGSSGSDGGLLLPGRRGLDVVAPQAIGVADVQPAVGDHRVSPGLLPAVGPLLRRVRRRKAALLPVSFWRGLDQGHLAALAVQVQP